MSTALSIPDQLRRQAGWCEKLGSPLYAQLLNRCAEDYERGGPLRDLLQPHENDPDSTVLSLRLMGAVHRLVLIGEAPELAAFYPSAGGAAQGDPWPAFAQTIQRQMGALRQLVQRPVQTNEVGRSGSLFAGFALIAARTGLPLRLLEIGASAGLNLRWDRYRYEWSGGAWGDAASGVRLQNIFATPAPFTPPAIKVADRAGCDLAPIDPSSEEGRLTLLSYVWADQIERIQQLKAALVIAAELPLRIDKMSGADWLFERLQRLVPGAVTVVFHSVVWQYIPEVEQQRIVEIIEDAGRRATAQAPLAWQSLEPSGNRAEIRLRIYPGFEERAIATTRPHAPSVRWLPES